MTYNDHLLVQLSEECAEVSQRASKAMRFGLNETQTGQPLNNAERIQEEFADLLGVYDLLVKSGVLTFPSRVSVKAKQTKVLKYLEYAKECGTLQ